MTNEKFNTIIRVLQKTLKSKNVEVGLSPVKSTGDELVVCFYTQPNNFCIAELTFDYEPVIKENKFFMEMEFSEAKIDKQCTAEEKKLMNRIVEQFKNEE